MSKLCIKRRVRDNATLCLIEANSIVVILFRVSIAPEGAQAAQIDIEAAYRQVVTRPDHRKFTVVSLPRGGISVFFVDLCHPFGLRSAGGNLGYALDASILFLKRRFPLSFVAKWVDDIIPTRIPSSTSAHGFVYDTRFTDICGLLSELGWPLSSEKLVDFSDLVRYIGFDWHISKRRVSLPEQKRLKFLKRLETWISAATGKSGGVTLAATEELVGSLNHVAYIFHQGRSFLPSLHGFTKRFHLSSNRFVSIYPPPATISDAKTWVQLLSIPDAFRSLNHRPEVDIDIWVDASTSWGIGLVVGDRWKAWKFVKGWKSDRRDIGWAESAAIELAVAYLASLKRPNVSFVIHSDNQGAIGSFFKGRGRNADSNLCIRRASVIMMNGAFDITPVYVASAVNRADEPSRGEGLDLSRRLLCNVPVDPLLAQWLVEA